MRVDERLNPDVAPEQLDPAAGVRRLNKLPLVIVGGLVMLVVVMLVIALQSRAKRQQQQAIQEEQLEALPDTRAGYRELLEEYTDLEGVPIDGEGPVMIEAAQVEAPPPTPAAPPLTAVELEAMKQRQEALQQALSSPTAVSLRQGDGADARPPRQPRPPAGGDEDQLEDLLRAAAGQNGGEGDLNQQARKEQFAETERRFGYGTERRRAPLTPYELRVGTVLSAVLLGGINSDLPGLVQAQVVQDVRDTRSGRHVLIPQGSRLIGGYDSRVSFGQRRVLVVWHRVMFPDASTLELGAMPGVDQAGFAGVRDQVRTHFVRIFGSATLLSFLGAGAQLAQPQDDSPGALSARDIMLAELAREWNQLGQQMIRRGMNVQPTLMIRPGYRFNVLVNKDLILAPYAPMVPVVPVR